MGRMNDSVQIDTIRPLKTTDQEVLRGAGRVLFGDWLSKFPGYVPFDRYHHLITDPRTQQPSIRSCLNVTLGGPLL